jgi:1-pyrroline-5-carboxylate dehydrogenase
MPFVNENTYNRYVAEGREEEFHRIYEAALGKVKGDLGKEYPILIGREEVRTERKMVERSPIDTSIVVGVFQSGSVEDVSRAVDVAKAAFKEWSSVDWRDRVELSLKAAEEIRRQKFELAALLTYETARTGLRASQR